MPGEFVKAAHKGELAPGQKKLVYLDGQRVLLVNVEGRYYALQEVCSHAQAYLSRGQVYGDDIVCPRSPPADSDRRHRGAGAATRHRGVRAEGRSG